MYDVADPLSGSIFGTVSQEDHDPVAQQIVMDYLEQSRVSLFSGDFDRFADCFRLPYQVRCSLGETRAATVAELRGMFEASRAYYADMAVTDLLRSCRFAAFCNSNVIVGRYETQLIYGFNQLMHRPYSAWVCANCSRGDWRFCQTRYESAEGPLQCRALLETRPPR